MAVRRLTRNPTLQQFQTYRKTIGHRIRDVIETITTKLHPVFGRIFPNFIAFHYFYIISTALLASILVYPVKNFRYIDILFLATGATTQGGLNTVDLNDLTLYQQIVLYITTVITSPIWIHSGLAFVRFYWFERYFDGIRDWSKRDFEMRRTMTLRQRELTKNNTNENIVKSSTSPLEFISRSFSRGERDAANFQGKLFRGEMVKRDEDNDEDSLEEHPKLKPEPTSEKFISRRKSRDINPADMYRSIAMLQNRHERPANEDRPALVIKSPAEREREIEEETRLKLKRQQQEAGHSIHFKVEPLPSKSAKSQGTEHRGIRTSFTKRKRPNFFQRKYSTGSGSLRDKLRRNVEVEDEEEEGHDADMEEESSSEDENNRAIESSNDEESISQDLNGRSESEVIHDESLSEPSSLASQEEEEDDDRQSTIQDVPGVSYYGLHSDDDILRPRLNRVMTSNYLSYEPKIGRNSTFVGLSDSQKIELGGVEYRSTKLLCLLLSIYYIGFNVLAMVVFAAWVKPMKNYSTIIREDGVSPTWWGFWTGMSSFTDLGLTLTPDSMMSFNKSIYVLIWMMWFIIVGNTGFPILLRFIIWILFKISPDLSLRKDSLGFLLDHPRRCFTMLFPKAATWWLFLILIGLNAIDLILFIILDLNTPVVDDLSGGFKVLNGLFQAVSTRTAGFSVLDLSQLHPSIQVSYMLMMYVSVMPLAISIRRTNVYEEQSLGIYGNADDSEINNTENNTKSFIGAHLRRQLSFDLWYMFLGLFIICICEGGKIQDTDKPSFNVFQILFEVVSAYGTVGLSLGYPGTNESFSAQFTTLSKLVIIAMLIRGRHRGLPYTLDRAIILPSAKLKENDLRHELTQSRRPTSVALNGSSVQDDISSASAGNVSMTDRSDRQTRILKRTRSLWSGVTSAFSMGHQPRLNPSLTARSFDETMMSPSAKPTGSQFSIHDRSSTQDEFRMQNMNANSLKNSYPAIHSSPNLFKESYDLATPDSNIHFKNSSDNTSSNPNSNPNSNSNSNSNSKASESSVSDPLSPVMSSIQSLHDPHSVRSLPI